MKVIMEYLMVKKPFCKLPRSPNTYHNMLRLADNPDGRAKVELISKPTPTYIFKLFPANI